MPFHNQAYLESLDKVHASKILTTHSPVGYHPELGDRFFVPTLDRFSGTYILGVQGSGKTCLLENLIAHDILLGQGIIAIDAHGDMIAKCIATLPADKLAKTYVLDMTDVDFPFGVNLFNSLMANTTLAQSQAVDKVMHIFEVLWEDILTQLTYPGIFELLRLPCLLILAQL